jgi:hypothetical protein
MRACEGEGEGVSLSIVINDGIKGLDEQEIPSK